MMSFIFELIILFLINELVSFTFHAFIPNFYLAEILVSVALAFIFAIVNQWVDRKHFYRYQRFWYSFFLTGILFCLIDFIWFII